MGFKSVFKKGVGSGMSPKKWIGFSRMKSDTTTLGGLFKSVIKRSSEAPKKETFEEAIKRFDLSEDDIKKRMKSAKELIMIFLGLGGLLIIYTLYQWVGGNFISGFICLTLSLLTFAYAFREHFNLFQMRTRRLGCTYSEWFSATFKGSK